MKKILFSFVMMLMATAAWAEYVEVDGIRYSTSSSKATVVAPESGVYTGEVNIPATFTYNEQEYTVVSIGSSAFKDATITAVTLPDGLEDIGQSAFQGTGLTSVTIPGNVRKMNGSAFQDCTNLTSVTIAYSENLTDGGWMFGKGVLLFNGANIFKNSPVTDLVVERPININDCPFTAVKRATFGSHVTKIPQRMFYLNGDGLTLETLTIGENVTEIGDYAFRNCTLPEGCTIPFAQFKKIGNQAFYQCKGLPSEVNLPVIEEIGSNAFEQCTSIESLTIGGGTIGSYAFNGCSNLSSLTLLEGVTEIGSSNFSNLTALTTVNIPSTMKKIGPDAFSGCVNMTIPSDLPEGLETIDVRAFRDCKKLNVKIPSTVKTLGQGAFSGCESLEKVVIPAGVTSLGQSTFYGCKGLTTVTIPGTLLSMGIYDFGYCENLKEVIFEKGTEPFKIGSEYAFYNSPCTKMYIDRNIQATYKGYIFRGSDVTVEFGPNCSEVGDYLFKGSTGLKKVTMTDNIKRVGHNAFEGAKIDGEITFSKKLETIAVAAFSGCTGFKSFTFPITVKEIGTAAFQRSSWIEQLNDIYVPWLTPLELEDDNPSSSSTVFTYANTTLWVPGGTMDAYQNAPIWKKFKNFDYWSFVVSATVAGKGQLDLANGEDVTDNGTNTALSVTGTALATEAAAGPVSGLFVREKDVTFTATPARGYELSGLTANDVDIKEASKVENLLADQTVVATFTPIIYKITYDLAGGEVATANPATYTVEDAAITLLNPTRTGYNFKGWTGTDLTEPTMTVVIPVSSIGDRQYTATWEPIIYSISYDLVGGSVADGSSVSSYTIETPSFTLINPTKPHWVFTGWTGTELSALTKSVTIAQGSIGDRSYTANWEREIYNVNITSDLEDMVSASTTKPKYEDDVILTIAPNDDYELLSLTVDGKEVKSDIVNGTYTIKSVSANVNVVAKYKAVKAFIHMENPQATYSFPQPLNFRDVEGLKAYIASGYQDKKVMMTRVDEVPANTGLLLVAESGREFKVPIETVAAFYINLLKPVTEDKVIPATEGAYTNFLLGEVDDVIGFYISSGSGTVAAGKAYLQLPTSILPNGGDAKGISFAFDDETVIDGILQTEPEIEGVYDMSGRKVADTFNPRKLPVGIYIVNGKKMVVK